MKNLFCLFIVLLFFSAELFPRTKTNNNLTQKLEKYKAFTANEWSSIEESNKGVVLSTKKIEIPGYPDVFNPSMIKIKEGYVLSFRYLPMPVKMPWISFIGIVMLDDQFNLISEPTFLDTRFKEMRTPSQAEDARLFQFDGKIYVIYNDNVEEVWHSNSDRRDMYLAEIENNCPLFSIKKPVKLMHEINYKSVMRQKNWIAFEWNNELLLTYTLQPHEILRANFETGLCHTVYKTDSQATKWPFGELRGSSWPVLDDGEYFAFFHSAVPTVSPASKGQNMWHYFMGAYCFSAEPPFKLTKMTPLPIICPDLFSGRNKGKIVAYPGGFVIDGNKIFVAYGKNDCEIWIATLDKEKLKSIMQPI